MFLKRKVLQLKAEKNQKLAQVHPHTRLLICAVLSAVSGSGEPRCAHAAAWAISSILVVRTAEMTTVHPFILVRPFWGNADLHC